MGYKLVSYIGTQFIVSILFVFKYILYIVDRANKDFIIIRFVNNSKTDPMIRFCNSALLLQRCNT